jgi:hypothetical protein
VEFDSHTAFSLFLYSELYTWRLSFFAAGCFCQVFALIVVVVIE